jgi:hypothetical protein
MATIRIPLLVLFLFTGISIGYAQEPIALEPPSREIHEMKGSHRLSLGLGHTHVAKGKNEGKTEWLTMGSFSFNYDYWLSNRFAVGVQSDLVLETFSVETSEGEVIEREYPVTLVPVGLYKIGKHLGLIGGVGVEFAAGKNLGLYRLGGECAFNMPNDWELSFEVVWDVKWDYYDSWLLGIMVSKILSPRHHEEAHHD